MRRTSLRPRQIDVHARMRIVRSQEDLSVDDDVASAQPSATFEELAQLSEKQQETAQKLRRKKNIPIPVTLTVASYEDEVPADFEVPTSYVRFQNVPSALEDTQVELDLELSEMLWLKRHPKYGDTGDPRYQISPAVLAKMLDCLEKACALINPAVITLAEAEQVLAKQLGIVKTPLNTLPVDVYNYWLQKRTALKRPLLRKNWPQTPLNDTNPHLVFRPREKERYKLRKHRKNDMDGYRKLQQLRNDFDRVRNLLDAVKRRERLKRMEIDFLEEIRRQAVYELTDRTGLPRKPVIPAEDDRDKLKKKKKKKKKIPREGESDGDAAVASNGAPAGVAAAGGPDPAAVNRGLISTRGDIHSIPTFMEYDTTENFKMLNDEDEAYKMPHYPSYPLPTAHLMAAMFSRPPKFRCRARLGRGGRLVVDRIPVPGSRYYTPAELCATRGQFPPKPVGTAAPAATSATSLVAPLGEAINASHHAPVFVQEASFRPPVEKIDNLAWTRLEEIYGMSDSEDEVLEPLTSSVYDPTGSKKNSSAGGGGKSNPLTARGVKFSLEV